MSKLAKFVAANAAIAGIAAVALVLPGIVVARTTLAVDTTLAGQTDGLRSGSHRCYDWSHFDGRARIAGVGAVSFTGYWQNGCDTSIESDDANGTSYPCYLRVLELELVTANGDKLVLSGRQSACPPDPLAPATWTVDSARSTGRFARYSGSGTFTFAFGPSEGPEGTVLVGLTGALANK